MPHPQLDNLVRAGHLKVEPPELSLDPNAGINCLADRFTLAYRQAFADFVNQALAERSTRASATAAAG